jgi:Zn-dependent protease with chaperone function
MIIGVVAIISGILRSIWRPAVNKPALRLNPEQEPQLFALIKAVFEQLECPAPEHIVLMADSSFFVTENRLNIINGKINGRVLALSYPMLRYLTINELRAVVAHEAAHFTGWDVEYTRRVYPVYVGVLTFLSYSNGGLLRTNSDYGPMMVIPSLIPTLALKLYLKWFDSFNKGISRMREHRADLVASDYCGSERFSSALKKLVSIGAVFDQVSHYHLRGEYRNGKGLIDYYSVFFDEFEQLQGQVKQELEFALNQVSTPNDTHPTLSERLAFLSDTPVNFADPEVASASTLLSNAEYGMGLTDAYMAYLRTGKIT